MPRKSRERAGGKPYDVVVSADDEPERWLEERRKLLTATDIPSILGVPGARSALETWYQKKDALMARAESDAIRAAKAAGHDFEDSNARMFAYRTGRSVFRSQTLLRSKAHPWLGCTLDYTQVGLDGVGRPLETKNAGSYAAEEMWALDQEPHLTWQVQLHAQTLVMDVKWGSLSAWLGAPYVHHRYDDFYSDGELTEIILDEGERFWKSLRRKSPPKTEPSAVSFAVLRRLSPSRATGKVISLPKAAIDLDRLIQIIERDYAEKKALADAVKARLDEERGKLAALIGENAGGKLPGGTVWTFKHVHVPAHNVADYSYRTLSRVSAQAAKPKRTTWKTSK